MIDYERMWNILKSESGYRNTMAIYSVDEITLRDLMNRVEKRVIEFEQKVIKSISIKSIIDGVPQNKEFNYDI